MTEREKIIDVLNKNFTQDVECTPIYTTAYGKEVALPQELCDIFNDIVTQAVIPYFADALIAAGIGDVSEYKEKLKLHRVFVRKDGGDVKVLYGNKEVDEIVKEREEYKHRAEVAERALKKFAENITCEDCPFFSDCASSEKMEDLMHSNYCFAEYLKQAEKELEEEKKDD